MIPLPNGVSSKSIAECNLDLFHQCVLLLLLLVPAGGRFYMICTLTYPNSHPRLEMQKSCLNFSSSSKKYILGCSNSTLKDAFTKQKTKKHFFWFFFSILILELMLLRRGEVDNVENKKIYQHFSWNGSTTLLFMADLCLQGRVKAPSSS